MALNPPNSQDMQAALDKFCNEADQIIQAWVKSLQEPSPIIYHYTNDNGFRGILESGKVWLTDIFKLNDPSELRHGFSHAINILKTKAAHHPPEMKKFVEGLESFFQRGGIQRSAHYFMCSFSVCGDDLGQWRAYADNGRGYALGFDTKALENGFINGVQNTEAFLITYKEDELDAILGQVIDSMLSLISLPEGKDLQDAAFKAYMARLYTRVTLYILRIALFFKHKAYGNEKEYRFLEYYGANVAPPNLKLRTRPHTLITYREFDWRSTAAGALKEIVVGPSADQEKARQFARDCLRSFHTGTVRISCSSIPYRAE